VGYFNTQTCSVVVKLVEVGPEGHIHRSTKFLLIIIDVFMAQKLRKTKRFILVGG